MNRRTEITVETHRLLVIRRRRGSVRGWCGRCLAEVEMITPNEAALLASVSSRTIYRWIEEAKLHFSEELSGSLLVCVDSFARRNSNERS